MVALNKRVDGESGHTIKLEEEKSSSLVTSWRNPDPEAVAIKQPTIIIKHRRKSKLHTAR